MVIGYTLKRSNRRTVAIRINEDGGVEVRAPKHISIKIIEEFLSQKSSWIERKQHEVAQNKRPTLTQDRLIQLADIAKDTLPQRCSYFADVMGVKYTGIKITKAATRWGSCSSKNSLCFSCRLMLTPKEAQDYVVVHELAHIIKKDHSREFWAIVESVMPDYKQRRKLLKITEQQ